VVNLAEFSELPAPSSCQVMSKLKAEMVSQTADVDKHDGDKTI